MGGAGSKAPPGWTEPGHCCLWRNRSLSTGGGGGGRGWMPPRRHDRSVPMLRTPDSSGWTCSCKVRTYVPPSHSRTPREALARAPPAQRASERLAARERERYGSHPTKSIFAPKYHPSERKSRQTSPLTDQTNTPRCRQNPPSIPPKCLRRSVTSSRCVNCRRYALTGAFLNGLKKKKGSEFG